MAAVSFLRSSVVIIAYLIATCLGQMPGINLPWGQYNTSVYDSVNQIYTWRNIRFGHPTNETRFQASTYPTRNFNDRGPGIGLACPQVDTSKAQCVDSSNGTFLPFDKKSGEDCLFLDLYVPASAIQKAAKGTFDTPVIVWIYGGAYIFGSKDTALGGPLNMPLYSGVGPLIASQGKVIMLAGNYRLGAFGWLAGPSMEQQGLPNAGLSDQRLLFQWVQDFIQQVGGDRHDVSAWGESAGASSILHHLISRDPKSGSLMPRYFNKVAIQSPAYEWQWDPQTLEKTFQTYSKLVGCEGCKIQDLQKAKYDALAQANQNLYQSPIGQPCTGLFPLGPAIDGTVIKHLTPVALNGTIGADFHQIDSMIVSHVTSEALSFIPWYMRGAANPTEKSFDIFLNAFIPEPRLKALIPKIKKQYALSNFDGNQTLRVTTVIQDAVFVCNTRHLFDAYGARKLTKYYAMSYDFLGTFQLARHASDVPAIFWNKWWDAVEFIYEQAHQIAPRIPRLAIEIAVRHWASKVAPQYQRYWTSHARFGDPNAGWSPPETWKPAKAVSVDGDVLVGNTLQPGYLPSWAVVDDGQATENGCNFWRNLAFTVEGLLRAENLAFAGEQPSNSEASELFDEL